MQKLLLITLLLSIHGALSAGIFSWTDESGNTVYGDAPPDTVVAKPIEPPKLTILENFGTRYKTNNETASRTTAKGAETGRDSENKPRKDEYNQIYTNVSILAPKANQSIRANDGEVSVALTTSPKLRGDHEVVIYLNGNEHSRSKSRVANLTNLDRGEHQLLVEIRNSNNQSLIKSEGISFNVLKNSVLTNKNKPYNPYESDPSQ